MDNLPLGARRLKQAAVACAIFYFTSGFATIAWMSRMPSIRDTLHVSPAEIGIILFIGALGSLVALPTAGPLIGAIGAKNAMRIAATLWAGGMLAATLFMNAGSSILFAAALTLVSAGSSLWGSAMNVEGGLVEVARTRRLLPQLHATYSIGAVSGAALTAALVYVDIPVTVHLIALAVPIWLLVLAAAHYMLSEDEVATFAEKGATALSGEDKRHQVKQRTKQAWTEKRTLMISVVVISAGLLEGSANDWLTLAMVDGYGFGKSVASLIFALFLLVMVAVRLAAPRLILRFGEVRLLRALILSSIGGLLLVGFAPNAPLALVGVMLWALGASLIFPLCGSALSYEPHMTAARMSVMTSIEFVSYLSAPPLLGLIAEYTGYHRALAVVIPIVLISAYLTKYLPVPRKTSRH